MLSHYHLGVFGKDIPGQWSCCKKEGKSAEGCSKTSPVKNSSLQRTQSVVTDQTAESSRIIYDEVSLAASLPVPDMKENAVSEFTPSQQQLYVRMEKVQEKHTSPHDAISLSSLGK